MAKFGRNTRAKIIGGSIAFDIPGQAVNDYVRRGEKIGKNAKDMKSPFTKWGLFMLKKIDQAFDKGGRGMKWAPLQPATVAEKARLGFGNQGMLQRTQKLRRNFRMKATKRTLQISNNTRVNGVSLFDIHQLGAPGANIPPRPMLVMTKNDRKRLGALWREHLYEND